MNAEGRKKLEQIKSELEGLKDRLNDMAEDEQSKFDNMSEGLQGSEKGQAIEQAASDLSEAHDSVESAIEKIEEVLGS